MLLRRRYDKSDPKSPQVIGVSIGHTGTKAEQNFSTQLVEQAIAQGWMSLSKGKLTLHADGVDLDYTIRRGPGTYCCHCGLLCGDGKAAAAHVASDHKGMKSPDSNNPSGYAVINGYECALAEKQHQQFGIKPGQMYLPGIHRKSK